MIFCRKFHENRFQLCDFFADNFLSVSFIPYGPEVGINKTWGQKFDSARKHNCSFKYLFQNDSNVKLVSHKKPILQFVYKARDRVLGACVAKRLSFVHF